MIHQQQIKERITIITYMYIVYIQLSAPLKRDYILFLFILLSDFLFILFVLVLEPKNVHIKSMTGCHEILNVYISVCVSRNPSFFVF